MSNAFGNYNEIFFAQEALLVLHKALGMAGRVFRGYDPSPQAYGDTIRLRRPTAFTAANAPAAATAQMVEAIVRDKKRLLPCAAYCDREYGVGGYYVGVPCVLGANGVERIVELDLTAEEKEAFQKSVNAVKSLVKTMGDLLSQSAS